MELWIYFSIVAAIFQTLRFMLQKQLSQTQLTATGATLARFLYSAPLVVVFCVCYFQLQGHSVPLPEAGFWLYGAIGGAAQVVATICTVKTFAYRNFAVGVTFKKTEVLQTAILGFVLFAEAVSALGLMSMVLGFTGVLVLSGALTRDIPWRQSLLSPATLFGLAAGALFGVSAVMYRATTLRLPQGDPIERALITLTAVIVMQLFGMLIWMIWRNKAEIIQVLRAWRSAAFVGITSVGGSFFWFTAFSLQNAAYVKAVGQIELIFSILAATLFFRERITKREYIGIGCISLSVLSLVIWG